MFARLVLIALVLVAGCEKTNHDNIDKWTHTEKGPGKLKKAFSDESHRSRSLRARRART